MQQTPPTLTRIGSRLAINQGVERQPPDYGEVAYFGTSADGAGQPLLLVALLVAIFALMLWQGNPATAGSTPQIETAPYSIGAKS